MVKSCCNLCRRPPWGLTQAEAEEHARTTGPNELARAVLFATGDATRRNPGGAQCHALLPHEARADAAAAKLKAMIHLTATVLRAAAAKENSNVRQ